MRESLDCVRRGKACTEAVALGVKFVYLAVVGFVPLASGEGMGWAGLPLVCTLAATVLVLATVLEKGQCS